MTSSGFRFDSSQQYQLDAINAVVDLFDGQPRDAERLLTSLRGSVDLTDEAGVSFDLDLTQEIGAIGNNLVLDRDVLLANLQNVQNRNGLEVADRLFDGALDFDIEMETGTGKTYVYLRTIFELAQKYKFTKFIILVPSVAIREGVNTSIRLMRDHFRELYPALPFDTAVYSGKTAEEVHSFATSTSIQILIMTIDSIKGDASNRIIHQPRNKLLGYAPIDYLKATHPVVIMDEPQNMGTDLSKTAIGELDPAFTLRYSATHKEIKNLVYRLDPVDAHDNGLVKQIVVAEVSQEGADAAPYMKLLATRITPEWGARMELAIRQADGSIKRKEKIVPRSIELSDPKITDNPAYEGIRIDTVNLANDGQPGAVDLTTIGMLYEGESIGGANSAIYREMIRETIKEHLHKEVLLRDKGIKVLSLFFIDKVVNYMGDGVDNDTANGDFARWFDEMFAEERSKRPEYAELLPQSPSELRKAYFSQLRRGKTSVAQDSTGKTKADDDAYELIMKDKERLLDRSEPVRFIFSHSALREGWDNPNVFQICTLREIGAEVEKRQTIGRGLRLPVMTTENGYERVADRSIASLTVIANESYQQFAAGLQKEYKDAGVSIGRVRVNEFAKFAALDAEGNTTEDNLGFAKSKEIYEHLSTHGFIRDGLVTDKFLPDTENFSLYLPEYLAAYEPEVIEAMRRASIEKFVKPKSKRKPRRLNKQLYSTPEFEAFWEAISKKTTYHVSLNREEFITAAVKSIQAQPVIHPLRIEVTKAGVTIQRGGAKANVTGSRTAELKGSYDLPDIVADLQESTSLTRVTIIDILTRCGRLEEFINNPNDFITMVRSALQRELSNVVVSGIEYEKISGSIYELRELQSDGEQEKERFLDQMYKVQHEEKTDFDYVVHDSDVEREFAELLDSRDDVRMFMKLPPKFKIPTPVGDYNPDWAIVKKDGSGEHIYMIRETKGTLDVSKLRPSEKAKIEAAKAHFAAIGEVDYAMAAPDNWNL